MDLFKESLTHLVIEIGPGNTVDYNNLKGFSKLTLIRVEFFEPADMSSCVDILNNSPHLESLEIQFKEESLQTQFEEEDTSTSAALQSSDDFYVYPPIDYPNIKKLHLYFFKLTNDKEISFIQRKFTNLKDLFITTYQNYWMDPKKVQLSTAAFNFLQHIQIIPKYNISFMDITDAATLKFKYPKNLRNLLEIKSLDLLIKSPLYHPYSTPIMHYHIGLGRFGRQNTRNNRFKDAQDIITFIGCRLENICIKFDTRRDLLGDYLEIILGCCPSIQRIELRGGIIRGGFPEQLTYPLRDLSTLVLNDIDTYESAMPHISENLPFVQKASH